MHKILFYFLIIVSNLSLSNLLGMQESKNQFFDLQEEALYTLENCIFERKIPIKNLVALLINLKEKIDIITDDVYLDFSMTFATLTPLADFFNNFWYWNVIKRLGLEEEKISLLLSEKSGALDASALKEYRKKRETMYKHLSLEEVNKLHKKTLLDGINILIQALANKFKYIHDSSKIQSPPGICFMGFIP